MEFHRGEEKARGFSLAELLLAFGLLAISILALGGLSISSLKAGQKSTNAIDASQIAVKELAIAAETASSDPAFWAADHQTSPYSNGTSKVGKTEFTYETFSVTLRDETSGTELGAGISGNRVKKLDIVVSWFGSSPRSGYGKRSIRESCLVNEAL